MTRVRLLDHRVHDLLYEGPKSCREIADRFDLTGHVIDASLKRLIKLEWVWTCFSGGKTAYAHTKTEKVA